MMHGSDGGGGAVDGSGDDRGSGGSNMPVRL